MPDPPAGSDGSPPEIAVVVSTYRRPDGLRRLVDALAGQALDQDRWEAVIVDNGSGPQDAAAVQTIVAAAPFRARLHRVEVNRGPAGARNLGWKSTSAPFIAFTDDDCQPDPSWLDAGLSALLADRRLGVVQGRTVRPPGSDAYPYTRYTVIREVGRPSPWFEGCNLFLRREALEHVGGFDETFGFFGEETALGWQTIEAGWQRGWAHDAVVAHELVDRPWKWHVRFHYLERNLVRLADRYPEMRTMLWRPWAVKKENFLFALAIAGLLGSPWRRRALLLAVPYLRWLPRPGKHGITVADLANQASLHGVSLAGKLAVAASERRRLLL